MEQTKNPFAQNVGKYILQIGFMEEAEDSIGDRMILLAKKDSYYSVAKAVESGGTQMKAKECYSVALYLRLSRDDRDGDGGKTESNSISSQRDMLRSYVRKQDNMEIYDIYADDGFSGTSFVEVR